MVTRWWIFVVLVGSCLTASDPHMKLKYTNQDGWVDPGDMLNYDTNTKTMKNVPKENPCQKVEEELSDCISEQDRCQSSLQECNDKQQSEAERTQECVCAEMCADDKGAEDKSDKGSGKAVDCEVPYFKQFIRSIFNQMAAKRGVDQTLNFEYQVRLTSDDWHTLDKFIHTDKGTVYDVHSILSNMVKRVDRSDKPVNTWRQWIEDLFGTDYDTVVTSAVFVLGTVSFLVFVVSSEIMSRCSWWKQIIRAFILLFAISVPWNWMHMYKEAVAKKYSLVTKDIPDHCKPGGSTVASGIQEWFYSMFTFSGDQCTDYHQALMVDPILEVAPTQALVVTFSKFVMKPLEHLGEAMGKFFNNFFKDMPMQVWPIATAMLLLVFVLSMIMLCGYSIKFPFYGGIEAPKEKWRGLTRKEQKSIEQAKQQQQQIEEMEKTIKALKQKEEQRERLMLTHGEMSELPAGQVHFKSKKAIQAEESPVEDFAHHAIYSTERKDIQTIYEKSPTSDPHVAEPVEGKYMSYAEKAGGKAAVAGMLRRKMEKPADLLESFKVLDPMTEEKDRLAREASSSIAQAIPESCSAAVGVSVSSMATDSTVEAEDSLADQREASHVEDIHVKSTKPQVKESGVKPETGETRSRPDNQDDKGDGDARVGSEPQPGTRVQDLQVEHKIEAAAQDESEGTATTETTPAEEYTESTRVGPNFPDSPPRSSVLTESTEFITQSTMDAIREAEVADLSPAAGSDTEGSQNSEDDFVVLKQESMESEGGELEEAAMDRSGILADVSLD